MLILGSVAAVAAWASGQGPGETAGERMDRFTRHQTLVEDLVTRGLDMANANSPLRRVEVCQRAASDLSRTMRSAAQADDPARVAELGDYLHVVFAEALLPNLSEARASIPDGSPDAERLRELRTAVVAEATQAEASIPATGKLATSMRINDLRGKLRDIRDRLK